MKIEAFKTNNITVLFSEPINHILISQTTLFNLFKTGDEEKDKFTFVEAPGLKVLLFPNQKKELAFEGLRILVNDKNEVGPEDSSVIDDFQKILNKDMMDQNKISAYGFNYDVVVRPESSSFNISDLVGNKISQISGLKSAGVNASFEKDNIVYTLNIKPIGSGDKFFANFNAHFNINKLPNTDELKKQIKQQYEVFSNLIQNI
ncbi:MAG: hypothetical protein ACD_24C00334G0002 [uncultured bacterium]|nr:MAG: hypothetical protein ACD_24C00334G0002 [uncultured bacterium]